ncbi:MAG: M23 family metallopeptidase [Planctomycetes bacterium]|nr:M23 family metallopeptidase [Planctomycetota bacterium]
MLAIFSLLIIGLVIPEEVNIPVKGATQNDWNHNTFWHEPWGASGVHKGIDIFGIKGTDVIAPTKGIVVFTGNISLGGNVVAILSPKWRIHYLAHLDSIEADPIELIGAMEKVGTLGSSGNASGKQPHVHYSIVSLLPYPWLFSSETQGWKKMFFLNPHEQLSASNN